MDVLRLRARVRDSAQATRVENMCEGEVDTNTHAVKNEESSMQKQLIPKLSKAVEYFKEYCNVTAIHGVRYLAEDHRYYIEKLFWLVALTICAIGCSLMIIKIKEKLDTTPVIVTFAESATNIWHLPFPAVTICPLTKSRRTVFNFTKYANMARDGEDMHDDYKAWVETMFLKMAEKTYYDEYIDDFLGDNTTWVKTKFKYEVHPYLYGESMSDELITLLGQLFALLESESLVIFASEHIDNSTWMKMKFADFHNESESLRKSMDNYYESWRNEIYQKLRALHAVCRAEYNYWDPIFGPNHTLYELSDEDAIRFLIKVAPEVDSNHEEIDSNSFIWNGHFNTPEHYFRKIWTDEGVCFTFNMMDLDQIYRDQIITNKMFWFQPLVSKDWDPDLGYSTNSGRETYPRRPLGVGKDAGLKVEITEASADIDYLCHEGGASGYKVILHRPEDQPQSQVNFAVEVPFLKDVSISVFPSLMTTSSGLKKYDAHKRQCYYSHEKHLEYFKFYSQNNCELECLTKVTLKICGCVAFYMPRNSSTKLCGKISKYCVREATRKREEREINEDLEKLTESDAGNFGSAITKTECDCLPSCVTISYNAEVSMVDIDIEKFLEASQAKKYYDLGIEASSLSMHIFYKDKYFLGNRRSELYGEIDFLANCGGLLGLFSGFSIISLIELIYFLTFRLWCNFYRSWKSRILGRSLTQANVPNNVS